MVLLYQNKMIIETIQYVYPDSKKDASLVMIQIRKGSKSSVKTLKPLFVFEQEKFSLEAQKIYKQARTHSIKC
jgi:tRNA1(Val) A37 N6-methylase TrmN6